MQPIDVGRLRVGHQWIVAGAVVAVAVEGRAQQWVVHVTAAGIGRRIAVVDDVLRSESANVDQLCGELEAAVLEGLPAELGAQAAPLRSEEHTSELQSPTNLVC